MSANLLLALGFFSVLGLSGQSLDLERLLQLYAGCGGGLLLLSAAVLLPAWRQCGSSSSNYQPPSSANHWLHFSRLNLLEALLAHLDTLLALALVDSSEVAWYFLAKRTLAVFNLFIFTENYQGLAQWSARLGSEPHVLQQQLTQANQAMANKTVSFGLLVWLCSMPFCWLIYPEKGTDLIGFIGYFYAFSALRACTGNPASVLVISGHAKRLFYLSLLACALQLLLSLVLAPWLSLGGLMLSAVVAMLVWKKLANQFIWQHYAIWLPQWPNWSGLRSTHP